MDSVSRFALSRMTRFIYRPSPVAGVSTNRSCLRYLTSGCNSRFKASTIKSCVCRGTGFLPRRAFCTILWFKFAGSISTRSWLHLPASVKISSSFVMVQK